MSGQGVEFVTPQLVIEHLRSVGAVDERAVLEVLGPKRATVSLNELEIALVDAKVLTDDELANHLADLTGIPVVSNDVEVFPQGLSAELALATGAVPLDTAPASVAMVEPTELNLSRVREAVSPHRFEVRLVTARRFAQLYRKAYAGGEASAAEPPDIWGLLDRAIAAKASDIHLSVGSPPVMRVDDNLTELAYLPITDAWMHAQVATVTDEATAAKLAASHDVDLAVSYGSGQRFRMNIGADRKGITWAIRTLPSSIPSVEDLQLPAVVRDLCKLERGLVLVTGPTGSGKSTTLAALLSSIIATRACHVLTLEDPIEFLLPAGRAVVHQREFGKSFNSWPGGIRQALRQDPDVILVGEARDPETIAAAVEAAETGALVFATLHTYDAAQTVTRIVSQYGSEQDHIRGLLSYVLQAIVSQTLVKAASGGRVGAFEVLVNTPAVSNVLRQVGGERQVRSQLSMGSSHGMQTLESHLAALVRAGKIAESDAEFKARDLDDFKRHLRAA